MTDLFKYEPFTSHAGLTLPWKIDCDALTDNDIECLAKVIIEDCFFTRVVSVPSGGDRLAKALQPYKEEALRGEEYILIVDDVLTTGKSMEEKYDELIKEFPRPIIYGIVIFSRNNEIPRWITPIFTLNI